jgi:predicted RNA-binding Zn-ribbon protein involved in translation (DUF1610 family)
MEVQEALVKTKEQACKYLALPPDLRANRIQVTVPLGFVTLYRSEECGYVTLYRSEECGYVTLYMSEECGYVTLYRSEECGYVSLYRSEECVHAYLALPRDFHR